MDLCAICMSRSHDRHVRRLPTYRDEDGWTLKMSEGYHVTLAGPLKRAGFCVCGTAEVRVALYWNVPFALSNLTDGHHAMR